MGAIMMERAKMMERFTFAADFVPLELSCGIFKFMLKKLCNFQRIHEEVHKLFQKLVTVMFIFIKAQKYSPFF